MTDRIKYTIGLGAGLIIGYLAAESDVEFVLWFGIGLLIGIFTILFVNKLRK